MSYQYSLADWMLKITRCACVSASVFVPEVDLMDSSVFALLYWFGEQMTSVSIQSAPEKRCH